MNHASICENIAGQGCGLNKVLNIIGGKWKILLLCVIDDKGVMRYGDLFLREGLAIGAVLVISTLIAMLVTAYTIIFVDKLVHKNKNKD